MNIDDFTDNALRISGLTTIKQRDEYKRKIDVLEERLRNGFDDLDFQLGEAEFLHLWLWSKNQNRFPTKFSESEVREYSSLPHIIQKDFENSVGHVGICAGLASEYIILAQRLGKKVRPVHLRGISDSHVYLKVGSNSPSVFINPVNMGGYDCDVLPNARRKSRIISMEELLGLLLANNSVADINENEYQNAMKNIRRAKSFYDNAPEIRFNEARIHFKLGDLDKSEKSLSELPENCSDDPKLLFLQGEIEYQKGNHRIAANIFRDVASYWSDQAQSAVRYIGISLDRMGYSSEAIHYLKQALDLNPEDGHARREFYKIMRKP